MKVKPNIEPMVPYTPGKSRAGAIKLSSNENPAGASPNAIRALSGLGERFQVYPDAGAEPLRTTLAGTLSLDRTRVIVGNGSDELMTMIPAAFLEAGENSVSGEYTFSQYEFATRLFSGEYRAAAMPDLRFDVQAILSRCDTATRIVWLCSPNNPTGTLLSEREIRTVLDRVSPETLVVLDEAYVDYVKPEDRVDSRALVDEYPNLLVLRTFSKIYGLAALRVGYAIGSETVISGLTRVKQPFNVNTAAVVAADAALSDRSFYENSVVANEAGRRQLYEFFVRHELVCIQSHANFVTVELPVEAKAFAEAMLENGVAVRPLASFGLPRHLRVTVGTEAQLSRFFSTFKAILSQQSSRRVS